MARWKKYNPPKDSKVFLADVNLPWVVPCMWNEADNKFCAAVPQCDLYEGHWNDWTFENEYYREEEIIRWMPLPELA